MVAQWRSRRRTNMWWVYFLLTIYYISMYYILQCNEERLEFVWIGTCGSEQKRRGNHGYARLCQSNKRFCPLFEPLLNVDPRCVSSRRASQLPHLEHLQRETERRWMGWMGVRPPEVCEASWRWNKAKWNHWVLHVSFLRWCLSGLWTCGQFHGD